MSSQYIPDQDTTPNGVLLKLYGNPLAHVLLHHPVSIPDRPLVDEGRCVGWGRLTREAFVFESIFTTTRQIEHEKTEHQLRRTHWREEFVVEVWEVGTERRRVSSHLSAIERERDSPRPTPSLPGSGGVHEPRPRRTVSIVSSFSSWLAIRWNMWRCLRMARWQSQRTASPIRRKVRLENATVRFGKPATKN